ncbi:hypothetical protein BDF20DRAFT_915525 [Mycotypha africana]|uniref:uncharacterized protein n=1 Tax=Mycotypha africana TaxID=64632 RepID=UPI002300A155|nr:uncharacterized protein BDF20DRAFT_915525 [Mycotypha africana]KAI8971751.1 hypothetical protein BDF20DRAFT_915525 [Mycotypha africana]
MSLQEQQDDRFKTSSNTTGALTGYVIRRITNHYNIQQQSKIEEHCSSVDEKCDNIMKRLNTLEQNLERMKDSNTSKIEEKSD